MILENMKGPMYIKMPMMVAAAEAIMLMEMVSPKYMRNRIWCNDLECEEYLDPLALLETSTPPAALPFPAS